MSQAVPQATDQGAHQEVAHKRKVRLFRSSLTMFAVSVGLIFVILILRDISRKEQRVAEYERCRDWLKTQLADLERLPAKLGTGQGPTADFSRNIFIYVDDATRFYAATTDQPVILVRSPTLHQWLTANGRAIVVKEGDQLRVEWVTEQEYNARQKAQDAQVAAALNPGSKGPQSAPNPGA